MDTVEEATVVAVEEVVEATEVAGEAEDMVSKLP